MAKVTISNNKILLYCKSGCNFNKMIDIQLVIGTNKTHIAIFNKIKTRPDVKP